MVGAGLEMLAHTPRHVVHAADHQGGVEERIADAGDVLVAESQPTQVVRVVRQLQVSARPVPGDRARHGRILLEHDRLLHREHRFLPEDLAGVRRVGHGHEVGMRPERAPGGEPQHPVAQRGEEPPGRRGRGTDVAASIPSR